MYILLQGYVFDTFVKKERRASYYSVSFDEIYLI